MAAGWNPDGTFVRANPDFQGPEVWQEDQQVPFKIIASRHDDHDNVLAQGIEECVNLDGVNQMRADLKLGNNRITGLVGGVGSGHATTWNQTISAVTFDNVTRNLTMTRPDGDFVVNIPDEGGGGGGTGTVNNVTGVSGQIAVSPTSPNSTAYTVGLAKINPGQTYTGGIGGITLDEYGRVTQVVVQANAGTNLEIIERGTINMKMSSSTGNDAIIPQATTSLAGLLKATDKVKIDNMPEFPDFGGGGLYAEGTSSITSPAQSVDPASVLTWIRIGNLVHFSGFFDWNSNNQNTSDLVLTCSGLPGVARSLPGSFPFITGTWEANLDVNGVDFTEGTDPAFTFGLYVVEGTKNIKFAAFYGQNSGNPAPNTVLDATNGSLDNAGDFNFAGWYFTDL